MLNTTLADLAELVATIAATMQKLDPDAGSIWEQRAINAHAIQKRALQAPHHPTMGDLQPLWEQVQNLTLQGSAAETIAMSILTAAASLDARIASVSQDIAGSTPNEDVAVASHLFQAIQNRPHSLFASEDDD